MILHRQFRITPSALEKMKDHLTRVYPREGCGVLAGDEGGYIQEIFCTANDTEGKKAGEHYEIAPLAMYELEKRAEEKGYSILGFYHSHPDCEPQMSSEDNEYMIPQMLYVIVSVNDGKCGEIRGYIRDL